jgi:hypothetical protein
MAAIIAQSGGDRPATGGTGHRNSLQDLSNIQVSSRIQNSDPKFMFNRRRFIQTLLVAAAAPATNSSLAGSSGNAGFGKLVPDPQQILGNLPQRR